MYKLKQPKEALEMYNKQLEILKTSDRWSIHTKKGQALEDLGKESEAMESFQKGIDIINNGTLEGHYFTDENGKTEMLSEVEMRLFAGIQELYSLPAIEYNPKPTKQAEETQEMKMQVHKLNVERDELRKQVADLLRNTDKNAREVQKKLDSIHKNFEEVKVHQEKIREKCDEVEIRTKQSEQTLTLSGLEQKVKVDQEVSSLDEKCVSYYKTFFWTIYNLFDGYRVASTGLLKQELDTQTEDGSLVMDNAKKVLSIAAKGSVSVPLLGWIQLIDAAIDEIDKIAKRNRYNNKVVAILSIIYKKFTKLSEIEINIQEAALAMTRRRTEKLKSQNFQNIQNSENNENPSSDPNNTFSKHFQAGLKWLERKLNKIKEKITGQELELHDLSDPGVALALQDATLFMSYLYQNFEMVIKDKKPIDQHLSSVVSEEKFGELFEDWDEPTESSEQVKSSQTNKKSKAKKWYNRFCEHLNCFLSCFASSQEEKDDEKK